MSMLIVAILLEALSAPVGLDLKEVARFAEVYNTNLSFQQTIMIYYKYISDINECARREDTCSDFAVCSNTIGSFDCVCFPGYQGDGTICRGMFYAPY